MLLTKMEWNFLEKRLSYFFCRYSLAVSRYPTPFIIVPVIFCLTASYGFVWKFEVHRDDLLLYTPGRARAKVESAALDEYFPINDSDPYFVERRTKNYRSGYIISLPKNRSANILQMLTELAEVWDQIHNFQFDHDGIFYSYHNLCVVVVEEETFRFCIQTPVMYMAEYYRMTKHFTYPIVTVPVGQFVPTLPPSATVPVFIGCLIGKPRVQKRHNQSTTVDEAEALLLIYQLRFSSKFRDTLAQKWEIALEIVLRTKNVTQTFDLYPFTSETLIAATEEDTKFLTTLLAPMFFAVAIFTIGCCFVNSMLRSKPWLGVAGIFSAALSVVASIGLLLLLGIKMTSLTYIMPFLTLAVGVDNIFIFIAAWRKTSVLATVEKRMYGTFKEAAVSMFVTAFTDSLAFAIGVTSTFPAVSNFCLFSGVAISFVFINQMTFFAGFMVVSGHREYQFKHCLTFRVMRDKAMSILQEKMQLKIGEHKQVEFTDEGISDHAAARFFKGLYTSFLLNTVVQALIVLLLYYYWLMSTMFVWNVQIGIHPTELVGEHTSARKTIDLFNKYFHTYSDCLHVWYTDLEKYQTDASDGNTIKFWTALNDDLRRFENTYYTQTADSWYRLIMNTLNDSTATFPMNESRNFAEQVQQMILADPLIGKYSKDIVFGYKLVNGTQRVVISATRFLVRLYGITTKLQPRATIFLRHVASLSNYSANVYHEFFEFGDQFEAIVPSLFTNIAIGTAAVVLTSLLLIPRPSCALWVCVTILSINVGTIGFMTQWNVRLDFISMVTIVMSIGSSVDFAAHIAYHFARSHLKTAEERLRDTLYVVGTPIVQSAFSTMLGLILLFIVPSYSFVAFAKTATLVIVFGLIHGVVILPVFLTVFHIESKSPDITSEDSIRRQVCKKCAVLGSSGSLQSPRIL